MSGTKSGYDGDYEESRTGMMENGQVCYVKNELYYIDPEIGLPAGLLDGIHINLYFDENDAVIAAENADELDAIVESRVILTAAAMATMVLILIIFVIVTRKTFGKPWYQWFQTIKSTAQNTVKTE